MDQFEILQEQEAKDRKAAGLPANEQPSLDSMEILNDETEIGDLDDGGNEGDDDHVVIKDGDTSQMEARYAIDGVPNWFDMATEPVRDLKDNNFTRTQNDWYLSKFRPIDMFGKSQAFLSDKYASFAVESAYSKTTHAYADYIELHRPLHAMTEGGKGIAMYTRPVVYMTADMSTINNFNITFGCPSNCSFCKESILARGYTQLSVDESTGMVSVVVDGKEPFEIPSKAKVAFWDINIQQIVYGPIAAAIVNMFPISNDSLDKLRSGDLVRLVSD